MRALSWNCRGLARPAAIQALKAWVKMLRLDCLFLMETKIGVSQMVNICRGLQFDYGKYIPSRGMAGGLCFLWNKDAGIEVTEILDSGFLCKVEDKAVRHVWSLLAVYGTPYEEKKSDFWDFMTCKINSQSGPWALIGDLNVILNNEDKSGGSAFMRRHGAILQNFLFSTGGVNLGYSGCRYTWQNKRSNGHLVKERLDRVIVDTDWLTACPSGGVRNFPITCSGHSPILLDSCVTKPKGFRPFRFFEAWFNDPSSWDVIKEAWSRDVSSEELSYLGKKINRTQSALRWWSKHVYGDCDMRIKNLELELQALQSKEAHEVDSVAEATILNNLGELWKRKESLWKQRSRETWLAKGDRNSSFFHASTDGGSEKEEPYMEP
ncbi:uncharacterized protein LOC133039470 [Cannabis sativa]|uniref:uncharacterized protein LOC133039470 n=1 Tax=Cannabis sativa TaxID=3483 RepID=UPI0029CAA537|nr:uncharacterized protein LOC133039470 [Cannabis sativa]